VKALAEAGNYTFTATTTQSGMPTRGRRGGPEAGGGRPGEGAATGTGTDPARAEAGPPPEPEPKPVVLTGHIQKDQPTHLLQGEVEAWRSADGVLVVRGTDGWAKMERPTRGGGRGGQDAAAGQDWQAMRVQMGLMRARLAHETLAQLGSDFAESLARSESSGRVSFTGTLSEKGLAALTGGNSMRGGRGGRGGQGGQGGQGGAPQMTSTGTFEIVLTAKGALVSVKLETTQSGSFGERKFERERKVEIQIADLGKTVMEVPSEVQEAFAAAATSEKEEEF
jgi:hypothetical protein